MPKKKKSTDENWNNTDPIDEEYKNLVKKSGGRFSKNGSGRTTTVALVITACICLVAIIIFAGSIFGDIQLPNIQAMLPSSTIAEGVTVAGVDVGGMSKQDAIAAVDAVAADAFSRNTFKATVLDRQWEMAPSLSGAVLDTEAAVKAAFDYGTEKNPQLQVDIIPFLQLNTDAIAADIAEFAKFFPTDGVQSGYEITKSEETELLKVTIGTDYYDFNETKFYTTVLDSLNQGKFQLNYPCNQLNITTIDLDAIYAEHCTDPVEAILDPETHEVTQSSAGYRFDLEPAKEALAAAKPGDVLEFPFMDVEPEMTTEELQSMLFRDELGTYTAYSSSSYNRDTNLWLACEAINGIVLYPGDSFSYNAALGERTAEKGYRPAASYLGNETIDTYGGGICQPSSSLYYACLIADLEIIQRECHGFVSSYMPLGMDATVDWYGPDFQFRNDTDFPIRIEAYAEGGATTVTLIGTDLRDYYVEMDYEVLGVTYPSVKEIKVDADSGHYDGEVKTSAYTGYTIQTYKLKYNKETDELISCEEEAYSVYSKRDEEVYRVKKEETKPTTEPTTKPTTKPTETDPPETEAPETVPPTTEPPETEPPETEPPETEAPETEPPETEAPETEPSETEAPETEPPVEDGDEDVPDEE